MGASATGPAEIEAAEVETAADGAVVHVTVVPQASATETFAKEAIVTDAYATEIENIATTAPDADYSGELAASAGPAAED